MRRALIFLLLLTAWGGPAAAAPPGPDTPGAPAGPDAPLAQPEIDLSAPPPPPVIQNRKHQMHTELALGAALLPSDAYSKEVGASLHIVHHFTDLIGWEIAHAQAYLDWRSSIRAQLEDNFGTPPQRFPVLRYMLDTNFVVSPVYAKLSLLNGKLLYLQVFALAGVGGALVQGGEPSPGSTDPGQGPHFAALIDVGLGLRAWLSERWSLRYELRQYVAFDTATGQVTPPFYMSLAVAVSLGGRK